MNTNRNPTTSNLYDKYLYSSTCARIAITYGINRLIKARKIIDPEQSIRDSLSQKDKIIQLIPPFKYKKLFFGEK